MIQAVVTGNIGRKPETKQTRNGKTMCNFSVASTSKRAEREPETTWVDVVCFDELAEGVMSKLDKGSKVVVTGSLVLETYERKDGGEGSSLRLVASDIGLNLRAKRENSERSESRSSRFSDEPW